MSSKNNRFSTIVNSIDTDINIIIDNETGFYNITKINNYIYKQNELTAIAVGSKKLINDWTRRSTNQDLIKELQKQLNTDNELIIKINDVNDEFKGTYVHKYLFEHILMWIDKSYAIKISIILNQNHIDYNKKLENKLIKKNCKIDELKDKIDKQSIKIDKLLNDSEYNKKQNKKLIYKVDDMQDTLNDIVEDVVVKTEDRNKLHEITIIKKNLDDRYLLEYLVIRTQKASHSTRINKVMQELYDQEDGETVLAYKKRLRKLRADHILLNFNYNGNSINLYNRIKEVMDDIFGESSSIEYTNSTRTGFNILKEDKFVRILNANDDNNVLDMIKQNLIDDNEELTIDNFLVELFRVVENMKRSASE